MTDAWHRAFRTLAQLIVAGGLTAMVDTFANGLTPQQAALVTVGWGVVVSLCHNLLEDNGTVPKVLK